MLLNVSSVPLSRGYWNQIIYKADISLRRRVGPGDEKQAIPNTQDKSRLPT